MHVVATAGHVDHGKSTLVRALTGTDPDRLEEEHRRGLTIELGYAWTALPGAGDVAFVDVPGHERFLSTMLSGIGPVPAVLFVVAADDPWMPQATEHLAALDALGVTHGVVAVTRSDLADPRPAGHRAAGELARTSLRGAPVVEVSARTGTGMTALSERLVEMLSALPPAPPDADVRLWVDRRFTVRGAGTVVTGTLSAGTIGLGDVLADGSGRRVRVRGVQSLNRPVERASGVARVALNVAGEGPGLDRGGVLVTPDAWHRSEVVDVRIRASGVSGGSAPPEQPLLHIGATSMSTHCRPLGDDLARLILDAPLPLHVGDRALLRDPGSRQLWRVTVLDPAPPRLRRRGAARHRADRLTVSSGTPDLVEEVARRQVVETAFLRRIGVPTTRSAGGPSSDTNGVVAAGGWLMSAARAERAARDVAEAVARHAAVAPLDPGLSLVALAERVGLPAPALVEAVVRAPLQVVGGRVVTERIDVLPADLRAAVTELEKELAVEPFAAPTAHRLVDLGLDAKAVAVAAKAGQLLRVAPGIVLLPGADATAVAWLAELTQPFTASAARERLRTTRRVVLPLLEHLDRTGRTRRLPDDRRELAGRD